MTAFLLVHGGGHGAWCWDQVVPHLSAPAFAVDLPGRGSRPADLRAVTIQACVDAVVEEIAGRDLTDVVLVGHSLAGVIVPAAAAAAPDHVRHLVVIAGMVPPPGRSVVDTLPFGLRQVTRVALPVSATRAMPEPMVRWALCNDMDASQARALLDRIGPDAPALMADPVSPIVLPGHIERTYVRFTRDRYLTRRKAARMAANLGSNRLVEIDAGHDGVISQAGQVAAVLNSLVPAGARYNSQGRP